MAYNLFIILVIFSKYNHSFSKAIYNIAIWRINLNKKIKAKETLKLLVILDVIRLSTSLQNYKKWG